MRSFFKAGSQNIRPLTGKVPLLILSAARPEGKTVDLTSLKACEYGFRH